MNRIYIIGRLGKDPDFSVTSSGLEIAKFSVAVTRKRDRDKTDWFNCTCFGTIVTKLIKPFVHKGSQVSVSGPFQFEEYEKNGEKKYSNGIIVEELELLGSFSKSTDEDSDTPNIGDPDGLFDDDKDGKDDEDSLPF